MSASDHQTSECSLPDCFCHVAQRMATVETPFTHCWNSAPQAYRRVTEREIAEYFYLCGRYEREAELMATMNEDLREMVRLTGERLR